MSDRTPEQIAAEILAKVKGKPHAKRKAKPDHIARDQGAAVLNDVHAFVGRFVAYPSDHARVAHVLWIMHTHLMDAWESTPRLAFLSPEPASGKTRSLEVTELLVPNPIQSVNVSAAYLFRKCGGEDGGPTVLFDEVDTVFGDKAKEHEDVRGMLNSGHRRGATFGRCVVRGKVVETEEIPSYAAVALAGLGWLPDTILSRSIIVRMRRRAPDETVAAFRRRVHAPEGETLCRRLAGWAATIMDEATEARPEMPLGVEDRAADCWEPLLAVADIAGGDWQRHAREAAKALVNVARDADPSLGLRLLADLRVVFETADEMATRDIIAALVALDEAPWAEIRGKPIDARGIANHLRPYGVRSKNIVIGEMRPKGYARADLHDAWRRYLSPSPGKSATSATSATDTEMRAESVAAVADDVAEDPLREPPEKPAEKDNVAAVAAVADFPANGDEGSGQETATVAYVADLAGNGETSGFPIVCTHCGARRPVLITGMPANRFWSGEMP
jgi:hypothetical protein